MDGQELRNRPPSNTSSSDQLLGIQDSMKLQMSTPKGREDFRLLCPFNAPPTPEAAVVRMVQNVAYFWLLYTIVLWTGLAISLIPERKLSLLLLVATSAVTCSYILLLRLLPGSSVLHRIVDKRLVVFILVVVAAIALIVTKAGIHLGITLAIGTPIVLVHALFRVRDDLVLKEETCNPGELFFLVEKKPKEESVLSTHEV